ncbi:MAG: RidA family protein [Nitrospirae bacterium]|nr:RidA family protein [Nitrospirota bacterium]MCL5285594.1 RidA family protein [Nitrospirota bacterium]
MPSRPGEGRRVIGGAPGSSPPVGPYSPGIEAGGWLFLSGQIALEAGGRIVPGGVAAEAALIFERLGAMLAQAGYRPSDVVKLTLYLTDLSSFQTVNDACAAFFSAPYPARVTVGVSALPKGANLEVDVIAWKGMENRENG